MKEKVTSIAQRALLALELYLKDSKKENEGTKLDIFKRSVS